MWTRTRPQLRENTPSKVVPYCYLKIDERAPLKVCEMYLLTIYGSVQKTPLLTTYAGVDLSCLNRCVFLKYTTLSGIFPKVPPAK